jgi:Nucleotidyl transferase AbiEii toxin, Type IV TA system
MPLTPFQRGVAKILASHRNPDSHIAGGAVINRADTSPRYSNDLDIFHDTAESVVVCAEADVRVLRAAGYTVQWLLQVVGFYRAELSQGENRMRLDWSYDSAFRFFLVQPDSDFGYCLHPADVAVNKVLALAGRNEIRDLLDILFLDQTYLSLGALMWAACGKDPGYTPSLLLDQANRRAIFHESDLKGEHLARPVDLRELKKQWLSSRERAEALFERLPEEELGCLYLDAHSKPVTPDPQNPKFPSLKRHFGSIHGAWPTIS